MTNIRFTWDPSKAESNWRKHGISFEDAAHVFFDPLRQTRQDRIEGGEYRWQTLGVVDGVTVLLVAHTFLDDNETVEEIHIISARRATRKERKQYVQENR